MKKSKLFLVILAASLCSFSGCSDDGEVVSGDVVTDVCGDGVIGAGEACDDGNQIGGDGCAADCRSVEIGCVCSVPGQACECEKDDEPIDDPPVVTSTCGNKIRESGEICDDGNQLNGDGCSIDCKKIEDGYTCPPNGGECWLTNPDIDPPEPVEEPCGNGELDEGEECDDYGTSDGDGCSSTCQVEEGWICPEYYECREIGCGDGIKQDNEECDYSVSGNKADSDYDENYDPNLGNTKCTSDCHFPGFCGDGKVQSEHDETCDTGLEFVTYDADFVKTNKHQCTSECKVAPYCGDGVFSADFEKCDPSVEGTGEGCNDDCTQKDGYMCSAIDGSCVEVHKIECGDGIVEGSEECEQTGNGCNSCLHADGYKCIGSLTSHCSLCDNGHTFSNYPCCTTNSGEQCQKISDGYGDGILDPDGFEECDDGNTKNGDGCSSKGKIESGYVCREVGKACESICGDGILTVDEACDDGNRKGGDGCSQTCTVEDGYYCKTPGKACALDYCGNKFTGSEEACDGNTGCGSDCHSVKSGYCYSKSKGLHKCSTNKCGNYILEYGEECDDGNTLGGDGCSADCKVEYAYECTNGVDCRPLCGDGKVMWQIGEECDLGDKNGTGMGCSIKCKVEKGFSCTKPNATFPDSIDLPVVYRDFAGRNLSSGNGLVKAATYNALSSSDCRRTMLDSEPTNFKSQIKARISDLVPGAAWLVKGKGYPDFEGFAGNLCFGLVKDTLDSEGKPVFNGSLNDGCCGSMLSSACSSFVQGGKYNGASYPTYTGGTKNTSWHHVSKLNKRHHILCADSFSKWYRTDSNINAAVSSTLTLGKVSGTKSKYVFDSSKAPYSGYFSPIDGQGLKDSNPTANGHNGNFTTEISTTFQYKGGESLNFSGDDDVWVFINGKLFLDIGGMHAKVEGQNTLSSSKCSSKDNKNGGTISRICDERYGIYENGLYDLKVFHAERAASGADFKLTLDGFINPGSVTCSSTCGDGVVAANEECDITGHTNDDVATKLGCVNCKWTTACGNGRVEGEEACDTGYLCKESKYANACNALGLSYVSNSKCVESTCKYKDKLCGNGKIDEGEDCDSKNDSRCNPFTCKYRCGDGILDANEECDLGSGNNDNGSSGCTTSCKVPFCGDGIVSAFAGEVCDDGVNNGSYGEGKCMPGCARTAPYCGDGIVQAEFDEVCDLGKELNNGKYGGCTSSCKRASYCGDGIVDTDAGEGCDLGKSNGASGSGCTATCQTVIN